MTIKLKPQGPRCKRFEFWTKVAKVTKPQGPKWQFTLTILKKSKLESNTSVLYKYCSIMPIHTASMSSRICLSFTLKSANHSSISSTQIAADSIPCNTCRSIIF
ncbi:hypothetical protein Hanom_Chr12g01161311 [Helianthus anomalus]